MTLAIDSRLLTVVCFLLAIVCQPIVAAPAVEDYGLLPQYRSFSISPDGEHYAYIQRIKQDDYVIVVNVNSKEMVRGINASKVKARSVEFLSNEHVILRASKTARRFGIRGHWENSRAISLNIKTGKFKYLLNGTENLHSAQSGMGRIVGFNPDKNLVYMPAFKDTGLYNLYRVSLSSGKGRVHQRGSSHTIDWFVSSNGDALAREDYVTNTQEHEIYSKASGKWEKIYSRKTPIPNISIQGVSSDGSQLLFIAVGDENDEVYSMDLTNGDVAGPLFSKQDMDIDGLVTDINRRLLAVKYSGFKSVYEFADQQLSDNFERLNFSFPMSNVTYLGGTSGHKKIVYKVSGSEGAGVYGIFDTEKVQLYSLLSQYPKVNDIGELKAVSYKSRDGLKIPSIITFPPDKSKRKNLPLIVMPHGGPESYDKLSFDWMAQYFASMGYVVLQPNFRGSDGFGYEFTKAGHGKWGREMQDDVSDGVKAMVSMKYADPDRVCIVGASYGGYSALAGGAFSPDLYQCVIAIAGVSDLPRMLSTEKRDHGKGHWVVSYWEKIIGNSKTERDKLKAISPIHFANKFQAPVLLVHGKDDTVVPIKQSQVMARALKKAKKPVEFITLKGEDHWLSTSSSRLALLKSMSEFLEKHNPPD
ncbi:S9 family peptidase [bacterium SCSIO 12696]|nr:S9 family peptidase [bacterium SCSIO 12696]